MRLVRNSFFYKKYVWFLKFKYDKIILCELNNEKRKNMSFYLPAEEGFVKRITDLKNQAINNKKITLLKFLDERQQELVSKIIGTHDEVFCYFDGGFANAEYKKCLITHIKSDKPDLKLEILKLNYNHRFLTPTHRSILGTLMSLGIKREMIGDIVVGDNCYICCSLEIVDFLYMEFKALSGKPVSLEKVSQEVISKPVEYEIKSCFVASLRLDVVICAMYNLSRNVGSEMIKNGGIKVNHVECFNSSLVLRENDLISIKGKGRVRLFKIGELTAKSRYKIEIGSVK